MIQVASVSSDGPGSDDGGGLRQTVTAPLRLLTLNICGPSMDRAPRLLDFLLGLDLDVVVLTETRANAGTEWLLQRFGEAGYRVTFSTPSPAERGVAVLRRIGLDEAMPPSHADASHRLVVDRFGEPSPLTLIAAYVPSRDASAAKIARKRRFLVQLDHALGSPSSATRTILMGDLNLVGRDHLPRYPAFRSWEYTALEGIAVHGLVDVFAELHPGVQAHSWIGRTGHGYRYDYAFVSRDLLGSVGCCEYLHEPREQGLSDHAGVLLTLTHGDGRHAQVSVSSSSSAAVLA
jgi:exodeoxyribonuclease-3